MTFSLSAPLFVEVAVPLPIDHPFTYGVPFGEEHRVQVGVRVLVPFGGRKMTGLVTAITDASALGGRDAKDLLAILDETPYVSGAPPRVPLPRRPAGASPRWARRCAPPSLAGSPGRKRPPRPGWRRSTALRRFPPKVR